MACLLRHALPRLPRSATAAVCATGPLLLSAKKKSAATSDFALAPPHDVYVINVYAGMCNQ